MNDMSDNGIPKLVNDALQNLVRAVNETSPRCVGIVTVVVFDNVEIVVPIIDRDIRAASGVNPKYALMETALGALASSLEHIPKEIEPGKLQ